MSINSAVISLRSSFRSLAKAKLNTTISLIGLSVAFLATMILLHNNLYEESFDNFHKDGDRIFRIINNFSNTTTSNVRASSFYPVAETLKATLPEVEDATRFIVTSCVMRKSDNRFKENRVTLTDKSFFSIYSVKFLKGGFEGIDETNSILLSSSLAAKYFGGGDALDELLEVENLLGSRFTAKVVGIFEDLPPNSHLKGDAFMSINKVREFLTNGQALGPGVTLETVAWRLMGYHTYIKVKEGIDIDRLNPKITSLVNEYRKDLNLRLQQKHELVAQPLLAIHTTAGFQAEISPTIPKKMLNIFYAIAGLILVVGWINYINLATARSVNRAREIGMRKVLGASKNSLINQFLLESFLLSLSSLVVATIVLAALSKSIELALEKEIFFNNEQNISIILLSFVVVVVGSLIAGIYPAFVLTSYNPLRVLKGKIKFSASGVLLRKGLMFFQLFVAIALLSSLFIVKGQINFMIDTGIGADIAQTIAIPMPSAAPDDGYTANVRVLKESLTSIPGVTAASISTLVPGIPSSSKGTLEASVNGTNTNVFGLIGFMDQHHIQLFDLNILAGRDFSEKFTGDRMVCIINRKAAEELGFNEPKDALDQEIKVGVVGRKIVGVMENFNIQGLQFPHEPIMMALDTALLSNYLTVKLGTGELEANLSLVKQKFEAIFPQHPYEYIFLDENFKNQYSQDRKVSYVFAFFSIVATLISCLGLFGLSSYMAAQKQKEVSIRKVLGSDLLRIFVLLNREYILLCFLSFIVTVPIVYYFMEDWLGSYHNRIAIGAWAFVIPFAAIQLIVFLVTMSQTFKTAMVNPAETLREQ